MIVIKDVKKKRRATEYVLKYLLTLNSSLLSRYLSWLDEIVLDPVSELGDPCVHPWVARFSTAVTIRHYADEVGTVPSGKNEGTSRIPLACILTPFCIPCTQHFFVNPSCFEPAECLLAAVLCHHRYLQLHQLLARGAIELYRSPTCQKGVVPLKVAILQFSIQGQADWSNLGKPSIEINN